MGQSNAEWGYLEDDDQKDAWDSFDALPSRGTNAVLDSFVAGKRITIGDLVRVGARLSSPTVLAFAFPGGLKFRDMVTGARWNYVGSEFDELKIIRAATSTDTRSSASQVLVCEGETDAARLSGHYECDVAILPVGTTFKPSYTNQLEPYKYVYVATDADKAGDKGAEGILRAIGRGQRFRPPSPATDWCDVDGELPALPALPPTPTSILVPAGELVRLEAPEIPSYLDHAVLPIMGTLILHGPYKSFKSWIALDLLAALAIGGPWAEFESKHPAVKVAVLNFEIPWAYYQQRVQEIRGGISRSDLEAFDTNFLTYAPQTRPGLVAGNPNTEVPIRDALVEADVKVVLIDPVRRAIGLSDPNAEQDVRKMLRFAEHLTAKGMSVVLVHHDNKDGDKYGGGDPRYMTGSGAWAGDVDSIVSLSLPKGEDRSTGTRRNLHFLLRNAPSPGPRGFEMVGNRVTYGPAHIAEEDQEGDASF